MNHNPDEFFVAPHRIHRFVEGETYTSSFGSQWHLFPKTQLDSFSKLAITRVRLRRSLGEQLWQTLKGQTVLEVGAGAGRFTEILLEQGARVVSVDLSSAVDVNAANFQPNATHAVIQADVMALPFELQKFDIVVCLGVIQHTPDSERSILKLAEQVKPDGWLVIDHYRWTWSAASLRPLYRMILKRLPHQTSFSLLQTAARFWLPLHRRARNSKLTKVVLNRVSPMITYYDAFPTLSEDAQREWALLDTFDALTDWYKRFRNTKQIRKTLVQIGFNEISAIEDGNGVEARARRPLTQ